jgi:Ca2+-binding EF-hand superfamily protein
MDLKKIFKNFDRKNKDTLEIKEFTKMIKIIDETTTQEEINYLFAKFDKDGDHTITFEEFESYLI